MTKKVIFGSIEFFEKEIERFVSNNQDQSSRSAKITHSCSLLAEEIIHEFICEDQVKRECLKNLSIACKKMQEDYSRQKRSDRIEI